MDFKKMTLAQLQEAMNVELRQSWRATPLYYRIYRYIKEHASELGYHNEERG